MTLTDVPVIDISPFLVGTAAGKASVAQAVGSACREIGFLVITGHGVADQLVRDVEVQSRRFFDLSLAEKMKVVRPSPGIARGYIPLEGESVARSRGEAAPGDLNESFMIGAIDVPADAYHFGPAAGNHFASNLWPAHPPELRNAYERYFRAMADLARTLMRVFALALNQPEDFFDGKIDRHISRLRVRNYPAPEVPPKPGQLRAGAHCDYGSLTILKTEDRPGGLEVCNADGQWVPVPILPGAYIVNIGELMARWTNDVWRSTLHRVVNPPESAPVDSRRQSLVFFHNPNYDAEVACIPSCSSPTSPPKYPVTTSGEHLRSQFVRTQTA